MRIKYLRLLDKYIGIAACFLLFIFERFLNRPINHYRVFINDKISKILIIKFWGFGSIVLAFDFFRALRKSYPEAYICALTLGQNRTIYEMSGLFDEVIILDIERFERFLFDVIKVIVRLRKMSFDVVFDLEFGARVSALFAYLSNARRRVGFKYAGVWRGDCFTDTLKFREDVKLKNSYLNLSRLVNCNITIPSDGDKLLLKDKECGYINQLLREGCMINGRPIIGVNINASDLSLLRRWPRDYFITLVNELIKRYSAHIIFVGGKEDVGYVNEAVKKIPAKENIHNFSGKTSLPELACLLAKLNLFISNDSGPLHLAVCVGVPTVSFFGPETPLIYGPDGLLDSVFYKRLDCSPCLHIRKYKHSDCIDCRCLKEITPSEVIDEIERKRIF